MYSIQRILIAAVLLVASGLLLHYAFAGDDKPGDQGVKAEAPLALEGNCPVCLKKMGKVVKGNRDFLSVYDGRTYLFPGEEQREMFRQNPDAFTGEVIEANYRALKQESSEFQTYNHSGKEGCGCEG